MRYLVLILIFFNFISCDYCKHNDNLNVVVNASLIGSYDSIYYDYDYDSIKHKTFDVRLSIINKTDKPIYFWIMTCSWQDNFIINNDYIRFNLGTCVRNFPRIRHINLDDSLIFKTSIHKIDWTWGQTTETTKFGFIYIDSVRCTKIDDYDNIIRDRSEQDKIIWSNPLYLNEIK